ncbi:MAG: hypothetical protein K2H85_02885, partial [Allobaculum sp.]|nr:hypothetical protein [Allobaculum sp.]
ITTEEMTFLLHLDNLRSLSTTLDFLEEADDLEDLEETLKDLIKDMRIALSISEDLIGSKKGLEIAKALLAAHEHILGME